MRDGWGRGEEWERGNSVEGRGGEGKGCESVGDWRRQGRECRGTGSECEGQGMGREVSVGDGERRRERDMSVRSGRWEEKEV